jgi:hypothetical protein
MEVILRWAASPPSLDFGASSDRNTSDIAEVFEREVPYE